MSDTEKHGAAIERAEDTSRFAEGGVLGMLERAKAEVEALAYFAAPEIGDDATHLREMLLMTIEGAVSQIQQDDAFIADMAKVSEQDRTRYEEDVEAYRSLIRTQHPNSTLVRGDETTTGRHRYLLVGGTPSIGVMSS